MVKIKNQFFYKVLFLFLLSVGFHSCSIQSDHIKPNIVFLLVDDLGWNDIGCYGSQFYETPNIDRLASEGMLFTDAYAACPVCSPTRASILTGKYPARLNITDWIPGSDPQDQKLIGTIDFHELPLNENTFAESLKSIGYNTAFFGKWHLGEKGYYPEDQGFDINKGGHWAGQPGSYFYPYKGNQERWNVPGLENGKDGEYLTDRLTDESLKFMESNSKNPFLLYFAYYNVHTPIQAKPEYISKFEEKSNTFSWPNLLDFKEEKYDSNSKQKQNNPTYAGMIQSVDESVGRIMQKLKELGLTDNTIIIFTSDNGGLTTLPSGREAPTSVVPLRAGKGWLYEGGIRVPAIIKWPNKVKDNSQSKEIITSIDFYATILELAGITNDKNKDIDGISLIPLITKDEVLKREAIFWHYPHYHGSNSRPSSAVRVGDFKLIEWFEDGDLELYNLKEDIGEQNNLASKNEQKRDELHQILKDWKKNIGAKFPTKNLFYEGIQH